MHSLARAAELEGGLGPMKRSVEQAEARKASEETALEEVCMCVCVRVTIICYKRSIRLKIQRERVYYFDVPWTNLLRLPLVISLSKRMNSGSIFFFYTL